MKYNPPFGSLDPDAPYVDRNVPGAVAGSRVPAAAVEDPQRELVNLILAAGLTPDEDDLHQLGKAIQSGGLNYVAAGGSANALTATLLQPPGTLHAGMEVSLNVAAANTTTAVTLNVNSLGAVTVYRPFENALAVGDIGVGINKFRFDGTHWRLVSPANMIAGSPASRWTKLSNGLIMQWGKVATNSGGPVTVTFPVTFPTSVGSVVVSDESSPVVSNQIACFGVGLITTSSFQCVASQNFSSAVIDQGNWIAMGY
ncbi:hypothetical protein GFL95_14290 [Rhizobium leguminosarum bv. viciae]|uniref:gp53-like domain-containing protein n=1 Tax=Rhizobium leguminosarum TaxID=384 RepID=UPI0014418414|nr:hypothetical protein [Rhizobium leguminosarum]NKK92385.1 hypothetical protein [Rhizobium leguminosarum bv. viciae]